MNNLLLTLILAVTFFACESNNDKTSSELRDSMHGQYVGTLRIVDTVFQDQEFILLELEDSLSMVIGMEFDSLIVKVKSIDFEDGLIRSSGDFVYSVIFSDKNQQIIIVKDADFAIEFVGEKN